MFDTENIRVSWKRLTDADERMGNHLVWKTSLLVSVLSLSLSFLYHMDLYTRKTRDAPTEAVWAFRKKNVSASQCSPKAHVTFLKDHKTASSTVQNILFRYAESRNLLVALPTSQAFQLLLSTPLQPELRFQEALCWDIEDVVSFKMNQRSPKTKKHVSEDTIEKIKDWNALDWGLYSYFNQTFWAKVERTVGLSRLSEEVRRLKEARRKLQDTCLQGDGLAEARAIQDKQLKPWKLPFVLGYRLKPDLSEEQRERCIRYFTPQLPYTALLYARQYPGKRPKRLP
ncbi:galactose-3-O-sulfotransferase 2 [Arapaima gigas]